MADPGSDPAALSPYGRFLWHCARGELAFQRDAEGQAVFYPRLAAPGSGGPLHWAISAGLGAVHAVTLVHQRDQPPHVVALIDLDEGFRMMSVVDAERPEGVAIGDRVRVGFRSLAEGQPALPVFTLAGEGA